MIFELVRQTFGAGPIQPRIRLDALVYAAPDRGLGQHRVRRSMTAWFYEALGDDRRRLAEHTVGAHLLSDLGFRATAVVPEYQFTTNAYALAVHTLLDTPDAADELRKASELAFETLRVTGHAASRRRSDAAPPSYSLLRNSRRPDPRCRAVPARFAAPRTTRRGGGLGRTRSCGCQPSVAAVDAQGRLGRSGRAFDRVVALREAQRIAETAYSGSGRKAVEWRPGASSRPTTSPKRPRFLPPIPRKRSVAGSFNVREQLQAQFDRSRTACERAELAQLHATVRLLSATAERMVANSIWTVTRGTGSRISRFVAGLVHRGQDRPVFEMLPPQRITLHDQGLLTTGACAVVPSLPTSSGKTFIAQFRIFCRPRTSSTPIADGSPMWPPRAHL